MIGIRCDYIHSNFRRCDAELWGLAFNAKPSDWMVINIGHDDHLDYCPEHAKVR